MKTILFYLLLIATAAQSQTDSASLLIRLQFKQKHIAYMGAELSERNTLKDQRIRDTLAARIGSGTKPDSVTTASYPAGFVLKFVERVSDEQAAAVYSYLNELLTGTGNIITQLNTKISTNTTDKPAATWLMAQLINLQARKEAVLTEKLKNGATWLKSDL